MCENSINKTNYAPPSTGGVGGESVFDECKKTCKRNFWTTVLQTFVKIGTAVLAAFGIASCIEDN